MDEEENWDVYLKDLVNMKLKDIRELKETIEK